MIAYAGNILSQLLNAVSEMGAKYSFLYISDPFRSVEYHSHMGIERFLAEGTIGNASSNSTGCDEVCQIKSSLLEGLLVVSRLHLTHSFEFFEKSWVLKLESLVLLQYSSFYAFYYVGIYCINSMMVSKSTVFAMLQGFVLLIILISGLCCMMGIDTPTRFETPEAS